VAAKVVLPRLLVSLLAGAGVGCAGGAFTAAPTDAGGGGNVSDGGGADGAPGFCAAMGATHLFCEDFDGQFPGKFSPLTTVTGGIGSPHIDPDTAMFVSPPQSAAAVTPALGKAGDDAVAYLSAPVNATAAGSRLKLTFDLQVGPGCTSNRDGATIAVLQVGTYSLGLGVADTGAAVAEIVEAPDGGVVNKNTYNLSAAPATDQWIALGLDANLGTHKLTVTEGTTTLLNSQSLQFVVSESVSSATILLGAHVRNALDLSAGCRIRIDNVLFDILP
jgi:hypothetical protein